MNGARNSENTSRETVEEYMDIMKNPNVPFRERLFSLIDPCDMVEYLLAQKNIGKLKSRRRQKMLVVSDDEFDRMVQSGEIELIDTGRPDED